LKSILNINPDHYNYDLPDERIAMYPVQIRDKSRLLVRKKNGSLQDDFFGNIADYLEEESHLFFNNSRVIPARLAFQKSTGARIEIFCLNPIDPASYSLSLSSFKTCIWECIIGNLKRFTETVDLEIYAPKGSIHLQAEKLQSTGNIATVRFSWDHDQVSFAEILDIAGQTPLPPYIKRSPDSSDKERYQTIYSRFDGSVAAPTAGLHFTSEVFEKLAMKNITTHEVTLHVGAGTFQPVKSSSIGDHEMHAEIFTITSDLIQLLKKMPNKVACVGTTSIRTLESLYWIGVKILATPGSVLNNLSLGQWEAYELPKEYSLEQSMNALEMWFYRQKIEQSMASTKLIIVPGYKFRVAGTLVTNFHQPRSTLLLLIAAFIGDSWKEIYNYALDRKFRFLSYGDSSLLFGND
jgi:S-adenosylmethionine:tRNA ribosyltransferase-isomerase